MNKLMAANWKMFKTRQDANHTISALYEQLLNSPQGMENKEVLVFAPFTAIESASNAVGADLDLNIGAQNFYPQPEGAFTGEISLGMLSDVGATWVLVGHSERRSIFGESLELLQTKAQYALEKGFKVVFCVGESLQEREAGQLEEVLKSQLACLSTLGKYVEYSNFAVAYEPVWAIGTGKVAGPDEILEAHALVRKIMQSTLGEKAAQIRILYGGSVKADNAGTIISLDNVDGVLVGGASLQADSFAKIVTA